MKKLVVLILFLSASTQAMAADRCTTLQGQVLVINGNGYTGLTEKISLLGPTVGPPLDSGHYLFWTTIKFPGEPADKVTGTCKDRHIVFTRLRFGSLRQEYDGWIFEGSPSEMAGVFSHKILPDFNPNSSPKEYGWYGEIEPLGCCQLVSIGLGHSSGKTCRMQTEAACDSIDGHWAKASTCGADGLCNPPPSQ